jgi:transcriptional regulator with XRE-family HTH domain
MVSREEILTRNKIIGVLLRTARLRAGESIESCAQVLSCDPEYVTRAEEGDGGLALPQLESLSHHLRVPLPFLLGEQELPTDDEQPRSFPYENVMALRHKIIGVILRRARLEAGRTLDDVVPVLNYTPDHLARIELGEEPIPMVELDILAQTLGIPFERFMAEDITAMTAEERNQRDLQRLGHLPPTIRDFVLQPINTPYLQIAMNLSQMPAETLRRIASGLLEITY